MEHYAAVEDWRASSSEPTLISLKVARSLPSRTPLTGLPHHPENLLECCDGSVTGVAYREISEATRFVRFRLISTNLSVGASNPLYGWPERTPSIPVGRYQRSYERDSRREPLAPASTARQPRASSLVGEPLRPGHRRTCVLPRIPITARQCYTRPNDTESETEKKHGFSIRSEWLRLP